MNGKEREKKSEGDMGKEWKEGRKRETEERNGNVKEKEHFGAIENKEGG